MFVDNEPLLFQMLIIFWMLIIPRQNLVYIKAKLIMSILRVQRNKYVMQSTALTNKINYSNKVQKKS